MASCSAVELPGVRLAENLKNFLDRTCTERAATVTKADPLGEDVSHNADCAWKFVGSYPNCRNYIRIFQAAGAREASMDLLLGKVARCGSELGFQVFLGRKSSCCWMPYFTVFSSGWKCDDGWWWGVGSFSCLKCRAFFDCAGHDALQLWHDDGLQCLGALGRCFAGCFTGASTTPGLRFAFKGKGKGKGKAQPTAERCLDLGSIGSPDLRSNRWPTGQPGEHWGSSQEALDWKHSGGSKMEDLQALVDKAPHWRVTAQKKADDNSWRPLRLLPSCENDGKRVVLTDVYTNQKNTSVANPLPTDSPGWFLFFEAGKSRWVEIFRGKGKGTGAVVPGGLSNVCWLAKFDEPKMVKVFKRTNMTETTCQKSCLF